MKLRISYLISFFCMLALLVSCQQKKKEIITVDPVENTTADSSAVVPQPDSLKVDPQTHETALQHDPPPSPAAIKVCNPNFNILKSPAKNHHVYYVSQFNPGEFKCWELLQKHANEICGGVPCKISYVDDPKVTFTSTNPYYMDAESLMNYGIGFYEHTGTWWEIKGARLWNRKGDGYKYYYTNHQGGG